MDIWRSVGNNSGEVVSRLRCSPVDERLSDSVNRKSYRTNSDIILFTVMFGLVPDIHRHKAQPHDMHVESNALQQRFVQQPVNAQGRPLVKSVNDKEKPPTTERCTLSPSKKRAQAQRKRYSRSYRSSPKCCDQGLHPTRGSRKSAPRKTTPNGC